MEGILIQALPPYISNQWEITCSETILRIHPDKPYIRQVMKHCRRIIMVLNLLRRQSAVVNADFIDLSR